MTLTSIQLDRAIGAVVASAAGDALGAQYEFGPALDDTVTPVFGRGVFGHAAREWTDDTSMAMPILDVLARGERLTSTTREEIVTRWIEWSKTARDVGAQTRAVLGRIPRSFTEEDVRATSRTHHERAGRSGGNGALMRTGPLALGYLERPASDLLAEARALSELTHWETDSAAACMIWCAAIRHAILTGELDVRGQVTDEIPDAARWRTLVDEALAPGAHPRDFKERNGWVVRAFQGALAAVAGAVSLSDAVERAIRGGGDTDTVAAIAGALAGAVWGVSAVPLDWRRGLHGWPGYTGDDLVRLAARAARGGRSDAAGWPTTRTMRDDPAIEHGAGTLVAHPHDPGVLLGSIRALTRLPEEVSAVVSLCRVGTADVPPAAESIQVWLIDEDGRNPNLDLVLTEAADMVAALRAEGRTVFLHCAEGRSRTAAVASLYAERHRGIRLSQAWTDLRETLPGFAPQRFLREAVSRITDRNH